MRVLLLHLDGRLPNLALMRAAGWHRAQGDHVELRRAGNARALEPRFDDPPWDHVYASAIFKRTLPLAQRVSALYQNAFVGGTGVSLTTTMEEVGVPADAPIDYTDYDRWSQSIGFTQRGCRLACEFCVVPRKEGKISAGRSIAEIWRGDPWPRQIVLLDNDFFGGPAWRDRIAELREGRFKVCFSQGINARMLNDETAQAIASVDYRKDDMKTRRIYTAWDGLKDERTLFRGLEALARAGVKPRNIMVYMLIGFHDSAADREHRRAKLREFGALPYPMPYTREPELVGFQRWVVGAYDKRIPWDAWRGSRYSPRRLGDRYSLPLFGDEVSAPRDRISSP